MQSTNLTPSEEKMMIERWNKLGIKWRKIVHNDGSYHYEIDSSDEEHE